MCKNDLTDGNIQPPSDKAKRALFQRISKQKVDRYYSKARCLNGSEDLNLDAKLKFINKTQHEFYRKHMAAQKMFIIERRRNIDCLTQLPIKDEIEYLDQRRINSSTLPRIDMVSEIHSVASKADPRDEARLSSAMSSLPESAVSALHEGIPTLISKPRLTRRIRTAPLTTRRQSINPETEIHLRDPLRYLERVENSEAFSDIRARIARKNSATSVRNGPSQNKSRVYPPYLALDKVEHTRLRRNKKQQLVEHFKNFHSGSDQRCNSLVKDWIGRNERKNLKQNSNPAEVDVDAVEST